tara:strand:+ start:3258 stop:3473 length:216 start_codon:yes stop_codon:yes gene_type:complete
MLRASGKAGYICMMSNMGLIFDVEYTDWSKLKPVYKDIWFHIARTMYVVIALEGGATVEEIPNVKEDDEPE